MYCDPVAGIRLSAQDTNVVVASCFRSSLEYQISWLCICFADNTGLLPLVRGSVSNCCLHSLILISIDHCPGNKAAAVQTICTERTGASAAVCRYLLNGAPAWIFSDHRRFTAPEISDLTNQ